jgi:ATP-dependent RNA helicase DeaD
MLKMGFQEDVETILADTPEDKHVALFSATMPAQIRRISKKYLTDAAEITVKNKTVTAANTSQRYLAVSHQQKLDALTRVLEIENFEGMIIFVRTKQATEVLAERLRARGFSAAPINGDVAQVQRERTIDQLRDGRLDILVATDVAARGLDVDRISHVVNYDIPTDTGSYVHRIGRTGRAGRNGDALSFVTPRERHLLRAIERATRQPLTQIPLPSAEDVNVNRVTKFTDSITAALESEELAFFRDLVSNYEQQHDVPAADIAAALAVLARDGQPLLMDPEPEPPQHVFEGKRGPGRVRDADGENRGGRRNEGPRRREPTVPLAPYTIAVGRRHRVQPRQIVGALANEGSLSRNDFGRIDIRGDHSVVELPADLPAKTLRALENTRISGKLIALQAGAPAHASRSRRSTQGDGPDRKPKKPRTKRRNPKQP